jgi:hypothetical protein
VDHGTAASPGSRGPDERAWNHALRCWFFRPEVAGRPVYFAVDEETLTAIAVESGFDVPDATESLSRVVQYRVSPREPLGWWVRDAVRWRRAGSTGDPPFLSVLAITVLAATTVDDVNDRRYYRRLNTSLGLSGNSMPRDFDSDIQQLWTYLNEWLTEARHGELGKATASNVRGPANVGWAQSQTLLRSTDRAKLPLFFSDIGAHPRQLVDGKLLVRRLESWSSGGHALSRRLGAVMQDARLSELLADALHAELAHWDGTLRDEVGRVALRLLLAFHERSGQLQAAVQVPEQLAGTTWDSPVLATPVALGNAEELQLLSVPITSEILDGIPLYAQPGGSGTEAGRHSQELTLVMPCRDVHLLCPDDRLARWVEVPSALLRRPHLVLVRSAFAAAAVDTMTALTGDPQVAQRIYCPPGWAAYRFTPSRIQVIDGPLSALCPRGNELSTLEGGLPISKRRRHYLTMGPPDLLLDLREFAVSVTVDGNEADTDAFGRLRLADLGLSPGEHSVSAGGVRYQLGLADEYADGPRENKLSFAFVVDDYGVNAHTVPAGPAVAAAHSGLGDVTLSGASLHIDVAATSLAPLPQPVRSRTGGRHFALGRPGQVAEVHPRAPRWLESLPVRLAPHLVDAAPALRIVPFPVAWLLRVSQGGITVSAIEAGEHLSNDHPTSEISARLWASVLPYIANAVPDSSRVTRWSAWKQAALTHNVLSGSEQQ